MINPINPSIPTIGQSQAIAKSMVAQGLQQLAMQIYVPLAVAHYPKDETLDEEQESLECYAKYSMTAAQCYFSGLGIAQFNQEQPHGKA